MAIGINLPPSLPLHTPSTPVPLFYPSLISLMASVDAKRDVYFTYYARTSLDDGGTRSCRSRGDHFVRLAPSLSSSGASQGRPLQRGDATGAAFAARGHICCVLVGRRPAADCLSNVFVLGGLISLAVGNSSSRLGFLRCLPAKSKSLFPRQHSSNFCHNWLRH